MIKKIDGNLLSNLSERAAENPRLRMNYNFHENLEDICHRLLNAIEPGTYICPHRHIDPPKPETFLAVTGRMAVLTFEDDGEIAELFFLDATGDLKGVDIPAGYWHSVVSLEKGSVFFETKPGPYRALSDKDFAPWAPLEGSAEAVSYLRGLENRIVNRL